MGLLAGMIPIPLPGLGQLTLGLAGVLLVALWLGSVRRTAGIVWTLPLSANLVLRNFGLTIFLAQVGLSSGPKFAATIADSGLSFVLLGALIVLPLVLVTMIVGRLLAIPADDLFGVVSGVTGNPAILAYASRAAGLGPARHRLCDDLPVDVAAENPVRADRRGAPAIVVFPYFFATTLVSCTASAP